MSIVSWDLLTGAGFRCACEGHWSDKVRAVRARGRGIGESIRHSVKALWLRRSVRDFQDTLGLVVFSELSLCCCWAGKDLEACW